MRPRGWSAQVALARLVVTAALGLGPGCTPLGGDEPGLAGDAAPRSACAVASECPTPPHGRPACLDGVCGVSCAPGWADCNGLLVDGCEVNLTVDVNDCGTCGYRCLVPNAVPLCNAGVCVVAACAAGFGDCDALAGDGCEVDLESSTRDCGACGVVCAPPPGAAAACAAGECALGPCEPGRADCDGDPASGCETDLLTDPESCGACGAVCPTPADGIAGCAGGGCDVGGCKPGHGDCNGYAPDGCEADLSASPNCGACGVSCANPPNGTGVCVDGACVMGSCLPGSADCDGLFGDGCEVSVSSDVHDCGQCSLACAPPPHALTAACVAGVCVAGVCAPGHGACGDSHEGCTTILADDVENCGACGAACPTPPNAQPICVAGECGIACAGERYDADGDLANGCETLDAPLANHSLADALDRGAVTACDGGLFTQQISGYLPADQRPHLDVSLQGNNTAEDWYVVTPLGELGCTDDLDFRLITSGGPESSACFVVTFFTNQGAYSVEAQGTGSAAHGSVPHAYAPGAPIYILVEKTPLPAGCGAAVLEDVLYVVDYHL
jgi:hypothetical protein